MKRHLLLSLLILGTLTAPSILIGSQAEFQKRMHATYLLALRHKVSDQMSDTEVEKILGQPDNDDWSKVITVGTDTFRIWLCVEKHRTKLKSWRYALYGYERYGRCYYYIFRNSHLLGSYIPLLLGKDDQLLFEIDSETSPEKWEIVCNIGPSDDMTHVHLINLLYAHGIACTIIGSWVHSVKVAPGQLQEAIQIVRDDAVKRGYGVGFMQGDPTEELPPKQLVAEETFKEILRRRAFSRCTAIGRLLRRKDVAKWAVGHPVIKFLTVREREYLLTPTKLSKGYEVNLGVSEKLTDLRGSTGATYQIRDDGGEILDWGKALQRTDDEIDK